jgi:hypothetical protein
MPDSIYLGAETRLITNRDNNSIKVYIHQSCPPPMLGRGSPVKSHMLRVKIHGQVRRKLISSQASKAKGCVSATRHQSRQGKARLGRASIPPIRELQVRVGGSQPGRANHHEDLEAKQNRPRQEVSYGTLSSTIHLIVKKSPEQA